VYDQGQHSIGKIDDVLIDKSGKITAFMVGVGGFLGIGEKGCCPAVYRGEIGKENDKWYLTVQGSI
jgi:PRC-barrel domain